MPLDPQAQVVIEFIEALGLGTLTPETDPNAIRTLMNTSVMPSSVELAVVEDRVIPGPAGDIPVRVYRPAGDAPKPVIVYFHGGGWVLGSLETHDGTSRLLADRVDAVVVSVDYRLAPEHRFPAAVDDAYAALRWVADHASELGGDPSRLVVAGDSAGGNLAAVTAQLAREAGPAIRFQLLIYPVTDHEFTSTSMEDNAEGYFLTRDAMRWFYSHYLTDEAEGADARVSPLRAASLSGLPGAFVITAEYDPLRDQGIAYAEAMQAADNEVSHVTYAGLFHGFFGMVDMIDAAKAALDDAVTAVRAAVV
jgi:acetyl esterase